MTNTFVVCAAMVALFVAMPVTAQTIGGQQCQPFQEFSVPRIMPANNALCSATSLSCCDPGVAKRTYNFALEDDGCGVVTGECLGYLTDIGCHTACAPNIQVAAGPGHYDVLPAICRDWATLIYNACRPFSWCLTSSPMTSTCKFLQTRRTSIPTSTKNPTTGTTSSGSTTVTSTVEVSAADTCSMVSNMNVDEFARIVLGVSIVSDGNCSRPAVQPRQLQEPTYRTNGGTRRFDNIYYSFTTLSVVVCACLMKMQL